MYNSCLSDIGTELASIKIHPSHINQTNKQTIYRLNLIQRCQMADYDADNCHDDGRSIRDVNELPRPAIEDEYLKYANLI